MDPEEMDAPEVLETPEEETIELDLTEEEGDPEKEALKKEADDFRKKNAQLFERLKKQPETKPEPAAGINQSDLYALLKADVNEEDIPDVTEYAKFKNISVSEALKTNVVKVILADKAEIRATAAATNTGAVKRNNAGTTDEALQEKALKGEMPNSDTDLERLIKARKGLK